MSHSQVPDREAVARLAFLDASYKGVQDPHLDVDIKLKFFISYLFKENLGQLKLV